MFKTAHSVLAATRAILHSTAASQKEVAVLYAARLKVLVADDEPVIADTLAMILEQDGYQTEAVYGGRQAVEKARRWIPDLFLSDVNMPELTGLQAAMEICTIHPGCKVLLFSGEPGSRLLVHENRLNGRSFDFLEKPIPPMDLLDRLRRLRAA